MVGGGGGGGGAPGGPFCLELHERMAITLVCIILFQHVELKKYYMTSRVKVGDIEYLFLFLYIYIYI